MNKLKAFLIIFLSLINNGCFLATQKAFVNSKPEIIKPAIEKVINEINWNYTEGPLNADIVAYLNTGYGYIPFKHKYVENADLLIFKEGSNPVNNTGTYGAIKLTEKDSGTEYEATLATESGDPVANSKLIIECAKQQIEMNNNKMIPCQNKSKSVLTFLSLNTLTPILSASYISKNNPLITHKTETYLFLQNGIGDVIMLSLLAGGIFNKNKNNKNGLIYGGIAVGISWRLLTLLNLTDLNDYNKLSKSKYDLKKIKESY